MTMPQILIQKAYITVAKPADVRDLEPLNVLHVGDQVSAFLSPDPQRFTSEPGSGIVFDPLTGLMWAQKETEELGWEAAEKACGECRLGGFNDWYLPSRRELETILDLERHNPALPSLFESNSDYVWTSTQTAWTKGKSGSSRSFFVVDMDGGLVDSNGADTQLRARPVRRASPASQ